MKEPACSRQTSHAQLDLLRTYRRIELSSILPFLPARGTICELGGGDGFQASLLAASGYRVQSFDIHPSPVAQQLYPVGDYDGVNIPLQDESVDVVFSSSVMEHVTELDSLLSEQWRILKPAGIAVHVMPNHLWRIATSVTHYPYLLKRIVFRQPTFSHAGAEREGTARRTFGWYFSRILAAPPHGTGRSALSEVLEFSPGRWKKRLLRYGFRLEHCGGAGLFYSGNALLPRLPLSWRKWVGCSIGSVCTIYVLRKAAQD